MESSVAVQVGDTEAIVCVIQIGAKSWIARAVRGDGESIEVSGDDPDYAVERVKQSLLQMDDSILDAA